MTAIADLIAKKVRLTRQGRLFFGLCPFHDDGKHPSFCVYPDHYYCFGCGAHGDATTWLMKIEGRSFAEAKKMLGEEYLPPASPKVNSPQPRENIDWPHRGVQWQETSFLRERLAQSHWSDEQAQFNMWRGAPTLSDQQLREKHPYAQSYVLERLRKVYPKP